MRAANPVSAISSNGRWLAFIADYAGQPEIYVKPFNPEAADSHPPTRISLNGASNARWNRDGTELFFQDLSRRLMVVRVQIGPEGIRAEPPKPLFQVEIRAARQDRQFAVTADGQRFLVILSPVTGNQRQLMTMVTNWQAGLNR